MSFALGEIVSKAPAVTKPRKRVGGRTRMVDHGFLSSRSPPPACFNVRCFDGVAGSNCVWVLASADRGDLYSWNNTRRTLWPGHAKRFFVAYAARRSASCATWSGVSQLRAYPFPKSTRALPWSPPASPC